MRQSVTDAQIEEVVALLVTGIDSSNIMNRFEHGHEFLRRRAILRGMDVDIDERIRLSLDRIRYGSEGRLPMCLDLAVFRFVPLVRMRQHPVGHGGFHSGSLGVGEAMIRWIYDCGSWRSIGKRALRREITDYARQETRNRDIEGRSKTKKRSVDLFFISHFDNDHVSGISQLINAANIDTVVVPYLDPVDRATILASSADGGGPSDHLASLMTNLPNWFRERGVQRVIQIRQGGPDTQPGLIRDDNNAIPRQPPGLTFVDEHGRRSELAKENTSEVNSGSGWIVTSPFGDTTDWALLPFVAKATDEARSCIETELTDLVGLPPSDIDFTKTFLEKLTQGAFRRRLKAAYKHLGLGDTNAISMSLYSGPYRNAVLTSRKLIFTDEEFAERPTGWLLTGDAELGNVERRTGWLSFYRSLKPHIGRLMLPHHGSAHNFDRGILDVADSPRLFVCVNTDDRKHPHENVRSELKSLGKEQPRLVTPSENAGIDEVSGPSELQRSIGINVDYLK